MHDEKSIERFACETESVGKDWNSYEIAVMEPWPGGEWVKYADHLVALGEAEQERDFARADAWAKRKAAEAAEKKLTEEQQRMVISRNLISSLEEDLEEADGKLESLRSGLKAEVERLRDRAAEERDRSIRFKTVLEADAALKEGERIDAIADSFEQLLDASEDTASCERCSGEGIIAIPRQDTTPIWEECPACRSEDTEKHGAT